MKNLKREVTYDGDTFKVRSDKVEIPDFSQMERIAILVWLNRHTYGRGYSTKLANPLQGLGGVIGLKVQ